MQSFRWDDARILLALLQTKTFSGAGKKLGLNNSTVSRRLDGLEETLNAKLFARTPDGVTPTPLALELQSYAEELARAAERFAMVASRNDPAIEGEVRLSVIPGIAESFLAPALPRLLQRWPRLRISMDTSLTFSDLSRREADLAIRVERPERGDLLSCKLAEIEEVPMTSADYAAELGALKDASRARWISWEESFAQIPAAQWVLRAVPIDAIVLRTNNTSAQLNAAKAGLGVALLGSPLAEPGVLVPVALSPHAPYPKTRLWLIGPRELRETPKISVVWEFIKEESYRLASLR